MYRGFQAFFGYYDQHLNHERSQLPSIFPTPQHTNLGFYVVGSGSDVPFSTLMLDSIPNLHVTGAGSGGQFIPRWTYTGSQPVEGAFDFGSSTAEVDEHGYRRIDNITDAILEHYCQVIGARVTKDDIFYSIYGQLHDPTYREIYGADLRKLLPRIPTPETRERFEKLAVAGRALADLHLNYESVEPYPLEVRLMPGADPADRETWRVTKMRWKAKGDHTTILYNPKVSITGIPEDAERYQLGSRSALGWILDRYQRKADPASGIVNDPNDWCDEHDDPQYIVTLIKRVTTVAVETMKIVDRLAEQAPVAE